uniref:uncharacterized protein LOC101307613 n=1 Tax=Fragaria vesca subsp. vesca TaxID=101020 RepID=UPI0005CA3E99|nr:PREDICTED: uncharacterized protein LOC101307613 [Fragaria vesca subsp. vesca]
MEDSFRSSSLLEHEGQKRIVHFSLGEPVAEKMTHSDVDGWMKMVTQYYVTELKLYMPHNYMNYNFPPASFDVGSLVVLSLKDCILDPALIQKDTIFCRLESLSLWYVNLNGLAGELFSRCPLLESLYLTHCENILHVELCDVPNLKNIVVVEQIHNDARVPQTFNIQAPNLESLLYQESAWEKPLNLEEVCCRNLKKLDVSLEGSTITNQYVDVVVWTFPFLEDLVLVAYKFGWAPDDEIKLSSRSLTKLKIVAKTALLH